MHESGGSVTVVVATDGEASHPNSMSHTRADLSGVRRGEVMRAVHALAPGARVHFLALPDGALRENTQTLDEALARVMETVEAEPCRTLIVAPWSGDGHRDHRVTAESVARVASASGVRHLGYPIWLWHWGVPDDVPWDAGVALALTPGERSIKARALRTHASQMQPLSDAPGDEPVVSESMQAHFTRDTELFFVEATVRGSRRTRRTRAPTGGRARRPFRPRSSTTSTRATRTPGASRPAGTNSANAPSCWRASPRRISDASSRSAARPVTSPLSSSSAPITSWRWMPRPRRWMPPAAASGRIAG